MVSPVQALLHGTQAHRLLESRHLDTGHNQKTLESRLLIPMLIQKHRQPIGMPRLKIQRGAWGYCGLQVQNVSTLWILSHLKAGSADKTVRDTSAWWLCILTRHVMVAFVDDSRWGPGSRCCTTVAAMVISAERSEEA